MAQIPSGISGLPAAASRRSTDAITLAVAGTSGDDTPSAERPSDIAAGDYTAYPFKTIQAAIDALPNVMRHAAAVNVIEAGDYAGFNLRGFNAGEGSIVVNGLQAQVTPATGPSTGTATSGSATGLTLTGAGWTPDDFVGKYCKIVSGQGAGQHFIIAKNTADTLVFAARMSPAPNATSVFEITEPTTRLTSNDNYFYSGIHQSGCLGPTFTVADFWIEGTTYGVTQLWSQSSLALQRVTVKGGYYGFIGQESRKAAWSQIGALNSTVYGIGFLTMGLFANAGFEKGWLAVNSGNDGIWVNGCHGGGCQGVYARGNGNNGLGIFNSSGAFSYVVADENVDGVWCSSSNFVFSTAEANNNTQRGFASDYGGRLDLQGAISGSGNGSWGVHAGYGIGGLVALTSLPTVTGASGDATVDGTNALVWATDFANVNDYAHYLARDAHIVRAA